MDAAFERRRFLRFSLRALLLVVPVLAMSLGTAEGEQEQMFPGVGEPRVLSVLDGKWTEGSWWSLAFTADSKTLIGTLVRNPGSGIEWLLGQRVGEVRSFDLTVDEPAAEIVTTARNRRFEILKGASGACRQPLLLARWHHLQPNVVEVVQVDNKLEEVVVRKSITSHDGHGADSICACLRPVADEFLVGTGYFKYQPETGPTSWWGELAAWKLKGGESKFTDSCTGNQICAVGCSADGELVAAGGGHSVRRAFRGERYVGRLVCWEENFGKKRFDISLPGHQVSCLAFAPDGKSLATGRGASFDGVVNRIDVTQGTVVESWQLTSRGRVQSMAYSPDGQLLAVGIGCWGHRGNWGETRLIDLAKSQVCKIPSSVEEHMVTCVAFSPDGKYLAAGSSSGALKLWELKASEAQKTGPAADALQHNDCPGAD